MAAPEHMTSINYNRKPHRTRSPELLKKFPGFGRMSQMRVLEFYFQPSTAMQ